MLLLVLFFFKQKTAYEMRISDWSSDVCSSDLLAMVAVPLVGVILIAVCVTALGAGPTSLEPVRHPPVPMSFGIALSALVGGNMLTVAAMPDLARFIRTERGEIGRAHV